MMKEINAVGIGSSFDMNNIKDLKGPTFLLPAWGPLRIDENGKIFYCHQISGKNGIESLVPILPEAELAIVGEPTLMKMAIAEKGLMVIDATVKGKSGHAAREEGINAIYLAVNDLQKIRDFRFKRTSKFNKIY